VTPVERLDEIEAWGQELEDASSGPPEQFEAAENISDLIAALRAVWEVVDDNTSTTAMQVRVAIDAALDVTS